MKKYYKQLNENGEINALFCYNFKSVIADPLMVEITAEEYEALTAEYEATAKANAEAEREERKAKAKESALKSKAYDIITGVE